MNKKYPIAASVMTMITTRSSTMKARIAISTAKYSNGMVEASSTSTGRLESIAETVWKVNKNKNSSRAMRDIDSYKHVSAINTLFNAKCLTYILSVKCSLCSLVGDSSRVDEEDVIVGRDPVLVGPICAKTASIELQLSVKQHKNNLSLLISVT